MVGRSNTRFTKKASIKGKSSNSSIKLKLKSSQDLNLSLTLELERSNLPHPSIQQQFKFMRGQRQSIRKTRSQINQGIPTIIHPNHF